MRFRSLLLSLLLSLAALAGTSPRLAHAAPMASTVVLLADLPKVDIDVDVHKKNDWYRNPVVIGLGAAVVVLLIVIASRR